MRLLNSLKLSAVLRVNYNLTFKGKMRLIVVFLFYLSVAVGLVAVSSWILRVFSFNIRFKLIIREDVEPSK